MDAEHIDSIVVKGTKKNPQQLVKKSESQNRSAVGEIDKLKFKVVVLHDGIGKEVHMTQPFRLIATDLITVA